MYERKSAVEHILHAPDMYIGSAQSSETANWVRQGDKIVQIQHPFVPGLYKLLNLLLFPTVGAQTAKNGDIRSRSHRTLQHWCAVL